MVTYLDLLALTLVVPPLWLGARLVRTLGSSRRSKPSSSYEPTVSVCIPARNETHAMTECLERVLASSYRKLEIIVLDDESKDNTSHLIKSFAHSGVRFVEGSKLPEGWLGKNHALEALSREASGEVILFIDVDTRLKPHTIEQLVAEMGSRELEMLSVVPRREDMWRPSVLFAPLRYFWILIAMARQRPVATSALWMVKRRILQDTVGGFAPLKLDSEPQTSVASIFARSGDYALLVGSKQLGATVEKKWSSAVETSIRVLYPEVGSTWYGVMFRLALLLLLAAPAIIVALGIFTSWELHHAVAAAVYCMMAAVYSVYTHTIWSKGWWLAFFVWPFVVLQEIALLVLSVIGYKTHTITWKGRSITTSARRVELPTRAD